MSGAEYSTVVVIGAGQAGLAMSWWLTRRGIDHVILERGEVANTCRTERWDSLRLLTPNWQSRLPGPYVYRGDDPDGFRGMDETICYLTDYARHIGAPVRTRTTVTRVSRADAGYVVTTDTGTWRCAAVVIASGPFNQPTLPACAAAVPSGIDTFSLLSYRKPAQLAPGAVLVVGAAASGVQIAEELAESGREVTLAVGEHVRVPRTYRGRDIQWWMDATGLLDERFDEVDDIQRARNVASFQLAGQAERQMTDLNALRARGVRIVGRLAGFTADGKAQFSGSLANVCALADLKLKRLLDGFDEWATRMGLDGALDPSERHPATEVDVAPVLTLDLARNAVRTIVWATGFKPDYSWLEVPVLDRKGQLRHVGGVVDMPGLYVLGLPFMRRRKSSLIDGVGQDAEELSAHLQAWLSSQRVDAGALAVG